jgi:fluoride exporter
MALSELPGAPMRLLLLAALGGAAGSAARHLVNVGFGRWLGAGFPWSTLFVNVAGGLLMGVLIEALALRFSGSLALRTFLATGVLGGFTTFSAFSLDFVMLVERQELALAAAYVAASVMLSILALYAGLALTRLALT